MATLVEKPIKERMAIGERNSEVAKEILTKYFSNNGVEVLKVEKTEGSADMKDKIDFVVTIKSSDDKVSTINVGWRVRPNFKYFFNQDFTIHHTEMKRFKEEGVTRIHFFLYCRQDGEDGVIVEHKVLDLDALRTAFKGGYEPKLVSHNAKQDGKSNSFYTVKYADVKGLVVAKG